MANLVQAERWLSARALGLDVFNFALREKSGDTIGTDIVGILGSFHVPKCGYLIRTGMLCSFFSAATPDGQQTAQEKVTLQKRSKHFYLHISTEYLLQVTAALALTSSRATLM